MPVLFSMSHLGRGSAKLGPDPEDYLACFQQHAAEYLENAYSMQHTIAQSETNGTLTTSLAEDIFSLLQLQERVLAGFLVASKLLKTRKGCSMLVTGLLSILTSLQQTQQRHKILLLTTLEDSCAAANDFWRISEMMEGFSDHLMQTYPFLANAEDEWPAASVRRLAADLVRQFSLDAVHAAERVHVFGMRSMNQSKIPTDLFSPSWEHDWTHNEVMSAMVETLEDYLADCRVYLATEFLYHKAVVVCSRAAVCCYIRCLIEKADTVTRRRRHRERPKGKPFGSRKRALIRMQDDIHMLREFFCDKAVGSGALKRIVMGEISVLELIHECLGVTDSASLETFIVVIHKRTGADSLVTRYFVGDLWLLVAKKSGQRQVDLALATLEPDLQMVSNGMKERSPKERSAEVSFVCLGDMLRAMYEDRIAQDVLPICWPFLPKIEQAEGTKIVTEKVRVLTRNIAELRWGTKPCS